MYFRLSFNQLVAEIKTGKLNQTSSRDSCDVVPIFTVTCADLIRGMEYPSI